MFWTVGVTGFRASLQENGKKKRMEKKKSEPVPILWAPNRAGPRSPDRTRGILPSAVALIDFFSYPAENGPLAKMAFDIDLAL
jgi:hypothetical protein